MASKAKATVSPYGVDETENIWVCCTDGDISRVREFLSAGVDVNIQDKDTGNSPIHSAASYNQMEMMLFLIENGADVNLEDADGDTPILLAETRETFELLEKHGAILVHKNKEGEGLMEKAIELASDQNDVMVNYLFERGIIPVNFEAIYERISLRQDDNGQSGENGFAQEECEQLQEEGREQLQEEVLAHRMNVGDENQHSYGAKNDETAP
jgi:hypothetical protein